MKVNHSYVDSLAYNPVMLDGGSFSYTGRGVPWEGLRRHLMAPPKVLWRRWRLPLPLATVPAVLLTWLGIAAAPHLHPHNLGWRAFAVGLALFAVLVITWQLVSPLRCVKAWRHGSYPPPAGADRGWYLLEPIWPRRVGLLLMAVPTALLQFWIQAAHDGGRTLDAMAAIAAFFFWAGTVRGLVAPGEPAVAVTASGVFSGAELYRWEEIGSLSMLDDDAIMLTVNGRPRFLELPHTDLAGAEVFGVLKYYLNRPRERRLLKSGW